MTETNKNLVLTYFHALQNKDWEQMRSCLSNNFTTDFGQIKFPSADIFIAFCKEGPCWSQTKLIDALFQNNQAALLYEGVARSGEKMRIGEFLKIDQDKITHSKLVISIG